MHKTLLLTLLLVACGKSTSEDKHQPAAEKSGPERISNHALATTPLQNMAGKAGDIAFTIDLPMAELKAPEVKGVYSSWEPKRAWFDTPSFTVQYNELGYSADYTGDTEPMGDDAKDRKIVRAEKLRDGGFINLDQRNDEMFFKLEVCRPLAKGALCCSVIQRNDKPLEAFGEIVGLAEKVCLSMKPT
ncbi:MAG TPA: hypothetical protein VLB44_00690 [Kofleriaceae bacterium]|nr:hypothetical protein [Kofleriaceae bacterium]